ncbi:MAG: hypothetical protein WCY19_05785 [Candidatus Gastranaerophilaceae bacterium]
MGITQVGADVAQKVYQAPKFVPNEVRLSLQQAKLTQEIEKVKESSKGMALEFVKDITIRPIQKAIKNYVDDIKLRKEILIEEKTAIKAKIAKLEEENQKIAEKFAKEEAEVAEDNARITDENLSEHIVQASKLSDAHEKGEHYYKGIELLDKIAAKKAELTKVDAKLERITKKLSKLRSEIREKALAKEAEIKDAFETKDAAIKEGAYAAEVITRAKNISNIRRARLKAEDKLNKLHAKTDSRRLGTFAEAKVKLSNLQDKAGSKLAEVKAEQELTEVCQNINNFSKLRLSLQKSLVERVADKNNFGENKVINIFE